MSTRIYDIKTARTCDADFVVLHPQWFTKDAVDDAVKRSRVIRRLHV